MRDKSCGTNREAIEHMRSVIHNQDEQQIEQAEAEVARVMKEAQKAGVTPEEMRAAIEGGK